MTCPRTGKWIGGCRFEARYDVGAPTATLHQLNFMAWTEARLECLRDSRPKTYVHDICVKCGKLVERTAQEGK